jgi:hypothetical protein
MIPQTEIEKFREENILLKKQIEDRAGKTVDQLYEERAKRVRDVIELKEPDRVPFMVLVEPHRYSGIPKSSAYYDHITLKRTMRKMAVELEPDMSEPGFPACGAAMTELDVQNFIWPGGPKPAGYDFQLPFFEAAFGDRLECLLELPKGKILASIEAVDAVRAKEILGGHTALLVRCPNVCKLWSDGQLESFIKDLIDKSGSNGGLIIVLMPDKARIEDMQAMLKSIKEYGKY